MGELVVPKLNNNDAVYVLVEWYASDGEQVRSGTPVASVETSKAVEDLLADEDGILWHAMAVGSECRAGDVVARLAGEGEERPTVAAHPVDALPASGHQPELVLTGSARELATRHGVDDARLRALGRRVVRRADVESLLAGRQPVRRATETGSACDDEDAGRSSHRLPASQLAVGRSVTRSHTTIPAAFTMAKVYATAMNSLRRRLAQAPGPVPGIPELLIKAVAGLREAFPLFFATLDGDRALLSPAAHVGVTVDTGTGLYVPVIRDATGRSLADIADQLAAFRRKARTRTFREDDLAGGTITISLTTYREVVFAVPIVFPGQACTLSLGALQTELFVTATGDVASRPYFHLGIAYDHRLINGRDAVIFLRAIRATLDQPATLADLVEPPSAGLVEPPSAGDMTTATWGGQHDASP